MIRLIHEYEATRPLQHPVGMTGAPIGTKQLLASPADWISPPGKSWLTDPPANGGTKVILVDNDHSWSTTTTATLGTTIRIGFGRTCSAATSLS